MAQADGPKPISALEIDVSRSINEIVHHKRALAAPPKFRAYLTRSLWTEFIALGLLAGLLASVCAEVAMAVIAERLFELPLQLHP